MNGLLPCGFAYLALAGAVAGGSISSGILYMAMFGIGTIPAMMAVSMSGQMLGTAVKRNINRFSPIIAIAVGLLLIYRGTDMKTDACCKEHAVCSTTK